MSELGYEEYEIPIALKKEGKDPPFYQYERRDPLFGAVYYTLTSLWARWRLKSLASRWFAQPFRRRRSKKTSKLRVTGLCEGNPPVSGRYPSQRASNAKCFHLVTSSWKHLNPCGCVTHSESLFHRCHISPFIIISIRISWSAESSIVSDKLMFEWQKRFGRHYFPGISYTLSQSPCKSLLADIFLSFGLCKGTVSDIWKTVEIPTDHVSIMNCSLPVILCRWEDPQPTTVSINHMADTASQFSVVWWVLNTLRPRQNGRHFPDDILKCILFNENVSIPIKISLKFVHEGPINNIPALVQIMAWRRPGDKPLSEPMMI